MSGVKTIKHRTENIMENTRIYNFDKLDQIIDLSEDENLVEFTDRDKAHEALDFIIESSGGLTDCQIEALRELIDGGFLEAIDDCTLKLHN